MGYTCIELLHVECAAWFGIPLPDVDCPYWFLPEIGTSDDQDGLILPRGISPVNDQDAESDGVVRVCDASAPPDTERVGSYARA